MLQEYIPVLASLVGLYVGTLVASFGRARSAAVIDGLVMVAIGALVLFHLLPESYAIGGIWALVAAAAGLSFPLLFERKRGPREPAKRRPAAILAFVVAGLMVHAAMDGAALAGAHHGHAHAGHDHSSSELLLALAIFLHRVPVGLWIQREAHRHSRDRAGIMLVTTLGLATLAGFSLGGVLSPLASSEALAIVQAFVVGSLLHVVMHPLPAFIGRVLDRRSRPSDPAHAEP